MLQIVSIVVIICVFLIAAYKDMKSRMVPFRTWYPMIAVCSPITVYLMAHQDATQLLLMVVPALIVTGSIYLVGYYKMIGGADAWAMIFIYLFAILPFGYGIMEYISIILQMSIIGMAFIVCVYMKKREWVKIPYIPAMTAALVYFFAFGAPL